jgi:quinol monooxygenase YgiN
MYTMVVQMSTDPSRVEQVARHLREDVVKFAKQQPGFVSGQWLRSADGSGGWE